MNLTIRRGSLLGIIRWVGAGFQDYLLCGKNCWRTRPYKFYSILN
ncbi:hypothetical protein OSCI_2420009 [Kamptonema sp. PCC 6506]|nr:hypothetical protein OSCI_2420009 [Kamptonema sp. PCC 6506]